MAIETTDLLEAIKQTQPAPSFFRDRYFSNVKELNTKKVEIDRLVKGARVAPIVSREIGGKIVDRAPFKNYSYETPLVAPETPIDEDELNKRMAGETVYTSRSPSDREAELAGEILADHEDDITRREELMCVDAISKGKLTLVGEGYNEIIDFWPSSNKPYKELGAGTWWNTETASILKDVREAKSKTRAAGAISADLVLGASAADAFLSNAEVLKLLDVKNVGVGEIDLQTLPDGVEYLGRFAELRVFAYTDQYDDDQGVKQYYLDPKLAVIGSPRAKTALAYGALRVKERDAVVNVVGRRAPYTYFGPGRDVTRYVGMKSAPLPINAAPDQFFVLKVVS